jgi:MFS transporter, DHA1 family, inner membrane transport protein
VSDTGASASEPSVRSQLATLTGAKVVTNTALRWVGPFLPTLERAFGTTTGTLTGIMGVAELGGLSTLATGSLLDRGRERTVFIAGIALVGISSVIALGGTTWTFAIAFALLIVGVANHTIAGHAWIGHRVPFGGRSRAIGIYETSWAFALLIGAPILALLIEWFGWRGPYVALALASAAAIVVVQLRVAPGVAVPRVAAELRPPRVPLPRTAWPPMLASATIAMAGLGVFVISGAWLDDEYGVSTAGLGLIAAGFGAVELASSVSVAAFADRIGARRSVLAGLVALVAGGVVMATAGTTFTAVIGLALYLTGFEFAFVASLTLVTEAAPEARGRAIGISNAIGTVARSTAVILSGQLFEAFGVRGSLVMASVATVAAFALTFATRLHRDSVAAH